MATDIVFTIEGLGAGTSSRLLHFAKGSSPSWDTDNAWVENCWSQMPGEVESSISFLDGGSTIGGLTLEVFAGTQTQQGNTISSMLYNQTRVSVATLEVDESETDTSIQLNGTATGLANTHVSLGREVIFLFNHAGSGLYTGCSRGRWGTTAAPHNQSDFNQIFEAIKGPVLRYRKVTLYRVNLETASSYSDLEQLGVFVLYTVIAPSPEIIRIECDSLISIFERGTILNDLWRSPVENALVSSFSGAGTEAGRRETEPKLKAKKPKLRQDPSSAIFSIDGSCVIKPDVTSTSANYVVQGFTEGDILRTLDTSRRKQELPDTPKEGWECFFCSGDDTDLDGFPLSSNLLTLFLQILTTTTGGANGVYDLGIEDLGLAISSDMVDVTGIELVSYSFGTLL